MMIYPSRTKLEEIAQNQVDEIRRLKEISEELLAACIDAHQALNNLLEFKLLKQNSTERELLSFIVQLNRAIAIAKAEGER